MQQVFLDVIEGVLRFVHKKGHIADHACSSSDMLLSAPSPHSGQMGDGNVWPGYETSLPLVINNAQVSMQNVGSTHMVVCSTCE